MTYPAIDVPPLAELAAAADRLGAMDTPRPPRAALAALIAVGLSLAIVGCSGGATSSPSPSTPTSSPPSPSASPSPSGSASPAPSAGDAGSPSGDPNGTVTSPPSDPGQGLPDPGATIVFPKPGVIAPKPVHVSKLSGGIDSGHAVVRVEWTSGIEPCSTLSSVTVTRAGDAFTLQVLEGPTSLDVVCIEIAMYKATLVDLGVLPSGSYTVTADPTDSAPITIVVP